MLLTALLLSTAQAQPTAAYEALRQCGPLYSLRELAFTFVVEVQGEEKVRRQHRWELPSGRIEVMQQGATTILADTRQQMPEEADDPRWEQLAIDGDAQAAAAAWAAFINDSYWLLAPCKLLDPGVLLSTEAGGLRLRFDGVGLTPGDSYLLEIDEDGRVQSWSFTLEDGRTGAFTWAEHRRVGPLELSLRRQATEGPVEIRFEDVQAR